MATAKVAIGTVTKRGVFEDNNNDYFYFFALGASDWTEQLYAGPQDPAQPDTVFLDHPYESRNFYYLTIATPEQPVPGPPKRIDNTQSGALVDTVGAVTPATFTARAHFEQDLEFSQTRLTLTQLVAGVYRRTPGFWEKWFWTSLSSGGTSRSGVGWICPELEPSLPAQLRLRVWGLSCSWPIRRPTASSTTTSIFVLVTPSSSAPDGTACGPGPSIRP